MKRLKLWFISGCFCLLAIAILSTSYMAEGGNGNGKGGGGGKPGGDPPPDPPPVPFNYRVDYINFPVTNPEPNLFDTDLVTDGTNMSLIAVGSYVVNGSRRGFIYDHTNNELTDFNLLLGLNDNDWIYTSCQRISSTGLILGKAKDVAAETDKLFWIDFFSATPTLIFLEDQFPVLNTTTFQNLADINGSGDIIIRTTTQIDGSTSFSTGFILNVFTGGSIALDDFGPARINESAVVIGIDYISDSTARYDAPTDTMVTFPEIGRYGDPNINNNGQFSGAVWVSFQGKEKKKSGRYAYRYSNQIDWLAPIKSNFATLNDSGDVLIFDSTDLGAFYHSGTNELYYLTTLVDDTFFKNSTRQLTLNVTNRDISLTLPAPFMSGSVFDANGEERIFFLIPQEP